MNEETKDCARLPVVAYIHPLYLKHNALGFEASACRLAAAQVGLCRADDAQALLAEKGARIAEQQGAAIELARLLNEACEEIRNLKAHIHTDNAETLANALKEIERLRLNIAEYNEHESCWRAEIANLRAQLEQLQAAPAERVVVLPERWQLPDLMMASYHEAVGRNQALDEVARLNPAPATAEQPWIPVGERLPESERTVLAYYLNSHGKVRRIRAEYIAAKTKGADDGWDSDCDADYDEATDQSYWPCGWYEVMDNWDGLTHVAVTEGDVTHWMPLPAAPATADSDVREVKP